MQTQDVASLRFIVDFAILRGASQRIADTAIRRNASSGNAVETQHLASAMRRIADIATLRGRSAKQAYLHLFGWRWRCANASPCINDIGDSVAYIDCVANL